MQGRGTQGYGLVGMLLTLLVLGGLAAIVLVAVPGSGTTSSHMTIPSLPHQSGQQSSGPISAAAQQACQANYIALQQAISLFQAEHGSLPTSAAELQTYLRGTVSTPQFTLTIDPTRPGQIAVQTAGHPASDGESNCRYAGG